MKAAIQQVVAYATRMGTRRALLVYPSPEAVVDLEVGPVRVGALTFDLKKPLTEAGDQFLKSLLQSVA